MSHPLLFVRNALFQKCVLLYCLLFLSNSGRSQQVPSPETFLGYPLGSHFTTHDKIVAYFREASRAAAGRMLLEQYGKTYEGRPLLLAYIASPENLRRLEAIRLNNLRLAGIVHDGVVPEESGP